MRRRCRRLRWSARRRCCRGRWCRGRWWRRHRPCWLSRVQSRMFRRWLRRCCWSRPRSRWHRRAGLRWRTWRSSRVEPSSSPPLPPLQPAARAKLHARVRSVMTEGSTGPCVRGGHGVEGRGSGGAIASGELPRLPRGPSLGGGLVEFGHGRWCGRVSRRGRRGAGAGLADAGARTRPDRGARGRMWGVGPRSAPWGPRRRRARRPVEFGEKPSLRPPDPPARLRALAPVAQLDRASVYGTESQRFESFRVRHGSPANFGGAFAFSRPGRSQACRRGRRRPAQARELATVLVVGTDRAPPGRW